MIWKSIRDKSGLVNPHYIKSDCGRYTVSKANNGTRDIFTAWRGSVSIKYGTAEECKQACEEDSLKPHTESDPEKALSAIADMRSKLGA